MEELTNTENKIAYSRQLYNSTVAALDAKIQSFPSNIVAKIHHFQQMDYLQVPEEAKAVPKVSFDDLENLEDEYEEIHCHNCGKPLFVERKAIENNSSIPCPFCNKNAK